MRSILRQPYPCELSFRQQWLRAFSIGFFVGAFLLVFQPFGLDSWQIPYKLLKVAGFGLITFLITAFHFNLSSLLLWKQFRNEHWTVGKEISWLTINILFIGLANRIYLSWLLGTPFDGHSVWEIMLITFLVGLFPVSGTVLLNYIIQLKRYSLVASELSVYKHPLPPRLEKKRLTLTADNEKDTISFYVDELLFVESSGNYSTIFYLKNNCPTNVLLRSSLIRLESQMESQMESIPDDKRVVRCHRSFIVNLEKVEKVTGNAQGYKLHLHNGNFQVPVARKYNETLVSRLKALS